jgi:hypothetical protein
MERDVQLISPHPLTPSPTRVEGEPNPNLLPSPALGEGLGVRAAQGIAIAELKLHMALLQLSLSNLFLSGHDHLFLTNPRSPLSIYQAIAILNDLQTGGAGASPLRGGNTPIPRSYLE